MLRKKWLVVLLLSLIYLQGMGQPPRFRIGDSIPDLEIKGILNYKQSSAKISEFKGDLLILDFWATWCAPCIASFAKLDSIQRYFKERVQILPIAYEDSVLVKNFLRRVSKTFKNTLPVTATNDHLLGTWFPHTTLPHYVWLDKNRRVIAISEGTDVNIKNIVAFFKSGKFNFTPKIDEERNLVQVPSFMPAVQLLSGRDTSLKTLNDSELIVHTTFTNYVEGFAIGSSFRDSTYFTVRNSTIATLYKIALFGSNVQDILNTSTMFIDISDSSLYFKIAGKKIDGTKIPSGLQSLQWLKLNGYSYESRVPAVLATERFNIMKEELNRYFGAKYGIIGYKERKLRKCLALIRISDDDRIATKGGPPNSEFDKLSFKVQNMNISYFITRLALPLQNYPPIIDGTHYSGKIDLEINCNLSNLSSLNTELSKYGLKLEEKEEMMNVGVIGMKKSLN